MIIFFHDIIQDDLFQKFLMALIIVNSMSIGVQGGKPHNTKHTAILTHPPIYLIHTHTLSLSHTHTHTLSLSHTHMYSETELPLSDHPGMVVLREFLNFVDAFTVIVFSVEIILKWMDSFSTFWKDPWNVFDLIVTVLVSMKCCCLLLLLLFIVVVIVCSTTDSRAIHRQWK